MHEICERNDRKNGSPLDTFDLWEGKVNRSRANSDRTISKRPYH